MHGMARGGRSRSLAPSQRTRRPRRAARLRPSPSRHAAARCGCRFPPSVGSLHRYVRKAGQEAVCDGVGGAVGSTSPLVHQARVQPVRQSHRSHRRTRLVALGQDLLLLQLHLVPSTYPNLGLPHGVHFFPWWTLSSIPRAFDSRRDRRTLSNIDRLGLSPGRSTARTAVPAPSK